MLLGNDIRRQKADDAGTGRNRQNPGLLQAAENGVPVGADIRSDHQAPPPDRRDASAVKAAKPLDEQAAQAIHTAQHFLGQHDRTARIPAAAGGFPPNVDVCIFRGIAAAMSSDIKTAPAGIPPAKPLPR